jgi:hypothetical protein
VAENLTNASLRIELPNRCPNGPITFEGLTPGYDYYGTCNAGACPGEQPPQVFQLAAGKREALAVTVIDVRGAEPCTKLVSPGTYLIGAVAPSIGVPVCVTKAELKVKHDMLVPPPNPRPAPKPSPIASEQVPEPLRCTQSSDCMVFCPEPPGCCTSPCGCKSAINRRFVDAATKEAEKSCTHPPHCPAYGCAYEQAFSAACVNGRCVASKGPAF